MFQLPAPEREMPAQRTAREKQELKMPPAKGEAEKLGYDADNPHYARAKIDLKALEKAAVDGQKGVDAFIAGIREGGDAHARILHLARVTQDKELYAKLCNSLVKTEDGRRDLRVTVLEAPLTKDQLTGILNAYGTIKVAELPVGEQAKHAYNVTTLNEKIQAFDKKGK